MATNSIQKQNAFQAAESATEIALNDEGNLTRAFVANGGVVNKDIDLQKTLGMDSWMGLRYIGDGIADGWQWQQQLHRPAL